MVIDIDVLKSNMISILESGIGVKKEHLTKIDEDNYHSKDIYIEPSIDALNNVLCYKTNVFNHNCTYYNLNELVDHFINLIYTKNNLIHISLEYFKENQEYVELDDPLFLSYYTNYPEAELLKIRTEEDLITRLTEFSKNFSIPEIFEIQKEYANLKRDFSVFANYLKPDGGKFVLLVNSHLSNDTSYYENLYEEYEFQNFEISYISVDGNITFNI